MIYVSIVVLSLCCVLFGAGCLLGRRAVFGAMPERDAYKSMFYSLIGQIGYAWIYAGCILIFGWASKGSVIYEDNAWVYLLAIALAGAVTTYQVAQHTVILLNAEKEFFQGKGPLDHYPALSLGMQVSSLMPLAAAAVALTYYIYG